MLDRLTDALDWVRYVLPSLVLDRCPQLHNYTLDVLDHTYRGFHWHSVAHGVEQYAFTQRDGWQPLPQPLCYVCCECGADIDLDQGDHLLCVNGDLCCPDCE